MKTLSPDSFIRFEGYPFGITCKFDNLSVFPGKFSSEESDIGGGRRGGELRREGSLRV